MTLTVEESNVIYRLLREAEQRIAERTGKYVKISFRITEKRSRPKDMLRIISDALGRDYEDYRNPSRKLEYVMLRRIGAYFLRCHYPLTLKEIGDFFGQDHTSIINSLAATKSAFDTEDQEFMSLFAVAQQAVSDWLNQ